MISSLAASGTAKVSAWQTISPGVLTVVTYAGFEPVCWFNPGDGNGAQGRDIDFLRRFAQSLGLELEVKVHLFDRIWERPARDEADIAAAGIAPLVERATTGVVWTRPYYRVQRSLLIRVADSEHRRHILDFAGGSIAVTRGSTADIDTVARRDPTTTVLFYDDQLQAVEDVATGKIDAFAEGDICARHFAAQRPHLLAVADVHEMEPPETFVFAVREASGLLPLLNDFIGDNRESY